MTYDWKEVEGIRKSVEKYYRLCVNTDKINMPMYDMFVTEVRKDWERAGFDFNDEGDLFKMWGTLAITLSALSVLVQEEGDAFDMNGGVHIAGIYGNMTGLFLREMTKNVPAIPAIDV